MNSKLKILPTFKNKEIKLKKIIPIISIQNSSKNTLLNILYNRNIEKNILLSGNKFINIFRYNPEIQEPKFFHLLAEFKQNNYIFYKDKKYKEMIGFQKILDEKKTINTNLVNSKETKYLDNIYMTEINFISFPELKNFFLDHDLCEFPLLSENKSKNEILAEDNSSIKENFDSMNIKDFNREILEIIKNNIENFIIIFDINNYKDEINYNIISQLSIIINKKIVNSLILFDISSAPGKYSIEYNNYRNNLVKYFPDFKAFNIMTNRNFPINLIQVESELSMSKSFYHLLRYYFCIYNYREEYNEDNLVKSESLTDGFINYLKTLIKTDLEELYSKSKNIFNEENKEIDNAIKELKEKDNIELIIIEKKDDDILDEEEEEEEINHKDILKMIYIYYKEKKFKKENSSILINLIDYFKYKEAYKQKFLEINKNFEINVIDKNDEIILDNLKNIIYQLEKTNAFKNSIINFKSDIDFLQEQNQNLIYIPFLGPSNSGKSTLLNSIIGNDILPTDGKECTKKGIIISCSEDYEPDITIRNAKLKEKGKKYYFEYDKKIIASGFSNVKEILKSLNYGYSEKEENSFYYVRTKIKIFENFNLDKYMKNKIFLIDFPGYGTANPFVNTIFPKIFKFCNCFTFIVRDQKINEIVIQNILNKALKTIKTSHDKFTANGFIKSCLFVCNLFDSTQTDNNIEIDIAKKDIYKLTKVKNEGDINICFSRVLDYYNKVNRLNYFFNIGETIYEEYRHFNDYKIYFFQTYIKRSSFEEYFNDIITKKLDEFGLNYVSDIEMKTSAFEKIKNKIDQFPMGKFTEKLKEEIAKKFYFAQTKLNEKFSYGKFEIRFKTLIENAFNEMKINKEKIIKNQIDIFKKILEQNFSENISRDSFKLLKSIGEKKIEELEQLYSYHYTKSNNKWDICSEFVSNISDYLLQTKKQIKNLLIEKDWKIIKNEIKNKIFLYEKGLSMSIDKFLDEINKSIFNIIISKEKDLWNTYIKFDIINFKDFFMIKVSKRGIVISEEIVNELNLCFEETKSQIWKKKGFIDWIESFIFNDEYLFNFIDIVINTLEQKLNYMLHLIFLSFEDYKVQIIRLIHEKIESMELAFINLKPEQLEKLKKFCEPKIDLIEKTLSSYLNKNIFN